MLLKNVFIFLIIIHFSKEQFNITHNISKINIFKNQIRKLLEELQEYNPDPNGVLNFFLKIGRFIYNYLEDNHIWQNLSDNEEMNKCVYRGIIERLQDTKMFQTCLKGSGKALNDFGNEFECETILNSKVKYFTLQFYLRNSSTISSKESKNILDFLEQHYFYIGLCLPKDCKDAVKFITNDTNILNMLYLKGNLSHFTAYFKDDVVNSSKDINIIYDVTIKLYFALNIIKIIVGTGRIIFMNKGYKGFFADQEEKKKKELDKNKDINLIKDKEEETDGKENNNMKKRPNSSLLAMQYDENSNDISSFYTESLTGSIISDDINLYNPFIDTENKFPLYLKIMKTLDFYDNVNTLSVLSNKYYNSFQIKRLYIIRFVLMIMSIMYQIVYSQMDLPYRYYIKNSFFNHYSFILIKLCINASTFWITLDAVIIGYKVMSYIKKEIKLSKSRHLHFSSLFKFLLLVIPKFVVFFFAFVYLHIFASSLTFELCKRNKVFSSYLYYRDTIQNRTYSIQQTENNFLKIFKNFIPFRLNYIDFYKKVYSRKYMGDEENNGLSYDFEFDPSGFDLPSPFLTNTDLFVNVYFNEFYLLIIMLIITYFSYTLRNKIYDYIILGINVLLFLLPILDLNKHQEIDQNALEEEKKRYYTLRYVLGQNYSEKYTHYFVNFFYFGYLIGVMKFYYDENISATNRKNHSHSQKINMPFEFCKKFITILSKLQLIFKRIILILSLLIIVLISSSFYFMQLSVNQADNSVFRYEMTAGIKFLFLYEKNLAAIFFFAFLTMFIVYPKSTSIIQLAERNGFIILERISFCFYCSFSYLIYAQFCVFIIYFQTSYMNLFLDTLGMFLITFTFSLFNTTLLELPLRQLIKSYMNKDLETKIENIYNEQRKTDFKIN